MKSLAYVLVIIVLTPVICISGALDKTEATDNNDIIVELLIYSGRPNPTWKLTDFIKLKVLKERLSGLSNYEISQPQEWSRLGFRGFRVIDKKGTILQEEIQVFNGIIRIKEGKKKKYFKDVNNLEKFLIEEANKQKLSRRVKEAIEAYEQKIMTIQEEQNRI